MIDISISSELKELWPGIALGCIQARVNVESSSTELSEELDNCCEVLMKTINLEDLSSQPRIKDGREAYKKLGKSPGKYRSSSEALIRRVLQGKGVYKVNNIVDINNLISMKSQFPAGSYDINNLMPYVTLIKAPEGAQYKGIGKELINIENLPVLSDGEGPFGSPTSDCERAMITEEAKEIIMCIYSFSSKKGLEEYMDYGCELLEKYARGQDFETRIVE